MLLFCHVINFQDFFKFSWTEAAFPLALSEWLFDVLVLSKSIYFTISIVIHFDYVLFVTYWQNDCGIAYRFCFSVVCLRTKFFPDISPNIQARRRVEKSGGFKSGANTE